MWSINIKIIIAGRKLTHAYHQPHDIHIINSMCVVLKIWKLVVNANNMKKFSLNVFLTLRGQGLVEQYVYENLNLTQWANKALGPWYLLKAICSIQRVLFCKWKRVWKTVALNKTN